MSKLPARTGLEWLKQGFGLFRRQPGILTMLAFANMMASILLSTLPLLGALLSAVLIPSFNIAILQTCHLIDQGERVTPAVLLTGFRQEALGRMCKLGLVYLGVMVVLFLAVLPWGDFSGLVHPGDAGKLAQPKTAQAIDPRTLIAPLAFLVLMGISVLALAFSPALTYWKRMPPFKAVFYSFFAVVGAARAVLAMLLCWLGILWCGCAVIAALFGVGQMAFVLITWISLLFSLVFQCAIFAAYKQIFGAPENEAPAPLSTPSP